MNITLIVLLALTLLVFAYGVLIYNNLVRLKHTVAKSWSNIDVVLKQRHDEIPKLVTLCKEYMRYEQDTLERIVRARNQVLSATDRGDVRALGPAESELRAGLGQLLALAENYPDLKANRGFRQLSQRISQLEDSIADRRELYNESVNLHNIRLEQFPDAIIARRFRFRPRDLLKFREARDNPDLDTLFRAN
ncbi:LemA family protein [Thiorhodovibrio winogradskyi]|uniref:LemA family protein n=1 Tax=Thiorhodovibrio winogradskyi TaxID=77007 RepID=A0ABZ0SCJ8_9GAMM|nr:LemA family protein [Thiorhodovibrio winogradskyi]